VVSLTAAYDLVGALLVFGLLAWLGLRPGRDGRLALDFALAYGVVRFAEGFARDDKQVVLGLDRSQLVAGLVVVASAGYLLYRRQVARGDVPAR
jgi:prolipoprotein diacylglyceryltransferase